MPSGASLENFKDFCGPGLYEAHCENGWSTDICLFGKQNNPLLRVLHKVGNFIISFKNKE